MSAATPPPLPARSSGARPLPPTPTPHNSTASIDISTLGAPPLPPRLHTAPSSLAPPPSSTPPPLPPRPEPAPALAPGAREAARADGGEPPLPRSGSQLSTPPPRPRTAAPTLAELPSAPSPASSPAPSPAPLPSPAAAVSVASVSEARADEKVDTISEAEFNARYAYNIPTLDWGVHGEKRDKIAYELLTTETTYVRNMQITLQLWRPALLRAARTGQIPASEARIDALFGNMALLLNVNTLLWQALKERFEAWSSQQKLGDVLKTLAPYLKMYTAYTANYDAAASALSELQQTSTRFAALHNALAHHALTQRIGLSGFLIQPVQRLPRYVLLLTDLLKHTPPEHPDAEDLTVALAQMREVAAHINEEMAGQENKAKCVAIEARFSTAVAVVTPSRRFVLEGTLVKQCRKERKPREFFLFNDVLIYAQTIPGTSALLHRATIDLRHADARDMPAAPGEYALQVLAPGKSFVVYCVSQAEKSKWLSTLRQTLDAVRPQEGAEAETRQFATAWAPDDTADACTLCQDKFTFIKRRHHCRQCGRLVCGACSEHRLIVKAVDPKSPVRVCSACYAQRTATQEDAQSARQ